MKCENALYLKNPAEDNLLKKKIIALLIDWKEKYLPFWSVGKEGLTTEKSSNPHPLKNQMARPLWFWVVSVWT